MRLLALLLGLASIAWGISTFPTFLRQSALETLAVNIPSGVSYRPEVLASFIPIAQAAEQDQTCRPEAVHGAAMVRLRLVENAMSTGARQDVDADLAALDASTRLSIACSPADPFLWMILSWVDGARQGVNPDQVRFLQMSYALGPNEGWVATRRNRVALSMFKLLPPETANAALDEFVRLLDSGFVDDAVSIFAGPGWPLRDQLLPRLANVYQDNRNYFAQDLYHEGFDVVVPGVVRDDKQPWR